VLFWLWFVFIVQTAPSVVYFFGHQVGVRRLLLILVAPPPYILFFGVAVPPGCCGRRPRLVSVGTLCVFRDRGISLACGAGGGRRVVLLRDPLAFVRGRLYDAFVHPATISLSPVMPMLVVPFYFLFSLVGWVRRLTGPKRTTLLFVLWAGRAHFAASSLCVFSCA